YGRLVIRHEGDVVDVSRAGLTGWPLPALSDDVEIADSNAEFVLVVEKEAVALRLAEARWCDAHPCVMVCGNGFPSFAAREFTRRLVETLRVPAYVCVDGDPGGIQHALTYAHGAISTAMETPWLACNDIRWAGVYPSDVDRFGIDPSFRISM